MFNKYTASATTNMLGGYLSNFERENGMDRHSLASDPSISNGYVNTEVTKFNSTTLSNILSSDKFIKFDLLARNVIDEGFNVTTKVQVGSNGKVKELRVGKQRFRQVGTSYYGDVSENS